MANLLDADNELRQVYAHHWPGVYSALRPLAERGRHLSELFLMDYLADNYRDAKLRVLVLGQQTGGWDGPFGTLALSGPVYVRHIRRLYRNFQLGANYRTTPFWEGSHEFYAALNPSGPDRGFLWSNLLKVDEGLTTPAHDVRLLLARYFNVLPKELELARPEVVMFFTGPNYDDMLGCALPGAVLLPFPGHDLREVAVVDHPLLPARSFRTYHPAALRRQGKWDYIRVIADFAIKNP